MDADQRQTMMQQPKPANNHPDANSPLNGSTPKGNDYTAAPAGEAAAGAGEAAGASAGVGELAALAL
jgi:hypothetical protein